MKTFWHYNFQYGYHTCNINLQQVHNEFFNVDVDVVSNNTDYNSHVNMANDFSKLSCHLVIMYNFVLPYVQNDLSCQ